MTYNKNNWKTGDVVTAAKLNNIENGVAKADNIFFLRYRLPTIGGQEIQQISIKMANGIAAVEMNYDADAIPYLERMVAGEPLIPIIDNEDDSEGQYELCYGYGIMYAENTEASEVDAPNYFIKSGRPVLSINSHAWIVSLDDLDAGTKPAH